MTTRSAGFACFAVVGCDSSDVGLDLAGTYRATTFTLTRDGQTADLLGAGGSLDLTLDAPTDESGRFSGEIVVPDLDDLDGFATPFSGD